MADSTVQHGEGSSTSEESKWEFKDEFWFNVTFIYRTQDYSHDSVYLAADFNGWSTDQCPMQPTEEGYAVTTPLSEGFYHYKFYIDGVWLHDERNPHRGGMYGNSIMFVHMDHKVYGLRPQYSPHRDYHRPNAAEDHFRTLCPEVPADIASFGILQRLVFVYLPPSYQSCLDTHYPVVYANDGQNLFSTPEHRGGPFRGGWYMDAKLDHFWSQGVLPEFILVAIPNADFVSIGNRNREYCTANFIDTSGDAYIHYLIDVVKKEVDFKFRTLPDPGNTVTLGASMGGLCSFVLALTRSDVFSRAICMSPSFWYIDVNNLSAYNIVKSLEQEGKTPPCKLYIDSGDGPGDNFYETRLMAETLDKCGWKPEKDFLYRLDMCAGSVDMGITHSESVWRERVLLALQFALS